MANIKTGKSLHTKLVNSSWDGNSAKREEDLCYERKVLGCTVSKLFENYSKISRRNDCSKSVHRKGIDWTNLSHKTQVK